ncbi:SusD/RagB family nutrient-binding outer membrane lipoprotein [Pedobacter hiemivivus]|uniref:SusD/RagB family nutrient-binding outer membrane lipoprotein n=1 Tax=Pedobacter hiemivivus TaxID=2530454 RepID=A0A4R0MCB3_9SPHI|nr:SusD/RagB family nutrient-binding outer membrane lipoprotein [Pedobacter hiemivivus]TCC83763.1 SusD/RagB family nutrient-binding outer membrane lipoprotein [Pedobacter hiemivivus]
MKTIIRNIAFVLAAICLSSCNKLDLNVNPVQPVTVPTKQRLPAIQANLAYSLYSQARFASYHSYYLTTRLGNTNTMTDTWNYNSINRMGAWRWHYFDVGSNVNGMLIRAKEEGSNNYTGVGKIILATSYLSATDVFGDMPMKEAYAGIFNPVYDTQEEVLAGIERLLDEGVAELNQVSDMALVMDATTDMIYNGNLENWKTFAKAVKARLKLRTVNFKGGNQELLNLVNDVLPKFEDALFRYPKASTSKWTHNLWGPGDFPEPFQFVDIKNDLTNTLPTDVLMKALTVDATTYDPRLFILTTQGENKKYLGAKMSEGLKDVSLPKDVTFKDFANLFGGYWTSDDSPFPILIKEELYFIKAETQFYMNDLDGALESYHRGIETNLKRLGVPDGQLISYMGSAKVAQNSASLKISDIMMQKYIALYLQGESWSDIKRYGYSTKAYPDFYYPRYALAEWAGKYIQRFPYDPQTEYMYNPKEMDRLGAKARNWVFTPVWWASNSTLKN